ncbi:hypothetical protein HNP46_006344 [Pseudomonas nitritireducens]|uniref:Uncharacterized protein n=1 Tax=Pseudomonas nitroreducens TaxID=46680 RepID=A0A7W7KRC4_PSENT|nr:hypothetical protein [Pseudomonas nitritireducens]MBB4867431.1 hypothetical protein [Pseudomonas nitritireducens]
MAKSQAWMDLTEKGLEERSNMVAMVVKQLSFDAILRIKNIPTLEVAPAFIWAVLVGDADVAEALADRLRGDTVVLRGEDGRYFVQRLPTGTGQQLEYPEIEVDNHSFDGNRLLLCNSSENLLRLMALASAVTGQDLMQRSEVTRIFTRGRDEEWMPKEVDLKGPGRVRMQLPYVSGGQLNRCELAVAMARRQADAGAFGAWFEPMLCVVDDADLERYAGHLKPIDHKLKVEGYDGDLQTVVEYTPAEIQELSPEKLNELLQTHEYIFSPVGRDEPLTAPDLATLRNLGGNRAVVMSQKKQGQTLCLTNLSFLLGLPHEPVRRQVDNIYHGTLAEFVPVDLLKASAFGSAKIQAVTYRAKGTKVLHHREVGYRSLLALQQHLPVTYFDALVESARPDHLEFEEYLALAGILGYRDRPYNFAFPVTRTNVDAFKKFELRLPAGSSVNLQHGEKDNVSQEELDFLLELCDGQVHFNGLSQELSTDGLYERLTTDKAYRIEGGPRLALFLLMRRHSIEEFIQHCETPEHGEALHEVFGTEGLLPYMDLLKDNVHTRMAVDVLQI